jgi:hypothetical protein
MALTGAKHEAIHGKTGDDLAKIKANFDNGKHTNLIDFEPEAAIIYQMQKMQDEINYLRTEISSNKDKAGVTTSQSDRITANHAKVGITTSQAAAITANTANLNLSNTEQIAVKMTVSKNKSTGVYSIKLGMTDSSGREPVVKQTIITLE